MSTATAELSSIATALHELAERVVALADGYRAQKREDVAAELYEAERALASATRHVERVAAGS